MRMKHVVAIAGSLVVVAAAAAVLVPTVLGQAERARASRSHADVANLGKSIARVRLEEMPSTESYAHVEPNHWKDTGDAYLSTFAIDVDTASYSLARRQLQEGRWPEADSIRVEEFLNYFSYVYPTPTTEPYLVHLDAAPAPWDAGKVIMRVGLQAKRRAPAARKPTHLTFLVDVSGSMFADDRLPLAQQALHLLVDNLNEKDTVGLVTYAGEVRLVLEQTSVARKADIHAAIESLSANGSTAMADGLALAYRVAGRTLTPDSESRVIVLSDGDANVGPTTEEELHRIIAGQAAEGVTLSVVGFGVGNYKDNRMEALADRGNGNYAYVDSMRQAKRLFQDQLAGTLELVAKDMKVQVEFDHAVVKRFRQVGYENRALANDDFRKDKVDAGELGAGHNVTALYELELAPNPKGPLATVRVRAKSPKGTVAEERLFHLDSAAIGHSFEAADPGLRFAVGVMSFAQVLRGEATSPLARLKEVRQVCLNLATDDDQREFVTLVDRARELCGQFPDASCLKVSKPAVQ